MTHSISATTANPIPVTIAPGDGIGPEIMEAVLSILDASGVKLLYQYVGIGEKLYLAGETSGIDAKAWEIIKGNRVMLKGPITTPLGKGYKSLNVTLRKTLGLFANIRPVTSYEPFIPANFKAKPSQNMNLVIVRENEEDLYAGIEYRPTSEAFLSLKLISRIGSAKIIKHAFEYARANNRKKVTCVTKNNIMKITDGAFASLAAGIAQQYPDIEYDHIIVDIGTARLASKPCSFDVLVTLNLYGDIMSDVAAEVAGSVGAAGSANVGENYAMFEAVHGSAPDIAGLGKANPSGLLKAAIMLLRHIGKDDEADVIDNAWLCTIEEGIHTGDIYREGVSKELASTEKFARAVIKNLGKKPKILQAAKSMERGKEVRKEVDKGGKNKEERGIETHNIIGCDIYVESVGSIEALVKKIAGLSKYVLKAIAQRGLIIWPKCEVEKYEDNFIQLRFILEEPAKSEEEKRIAQANMLELQALLLNHCGLNIVMVNLLREYEGISGFSKIQGE